MFDITTVGPAMISIGGFAAILELIRRLASDGDAVDESLPKGVQEEEPVRFRFPALVPAPSASAA